MKFETNIIHTLTKTGDKILHPFGPTIFQTYVDKKFIDHLLEEGNKLNKRDNNASPYLAGNLINGRSFYYPSQVRKKFEEYIYEIVDRYLKNLPQHQFKNLFLTNSKKISTRFKLGELWINYAKKGDFNPPHIHSAIFSFVVFCKVPQTIFDKQPESNFQHPGEIVFKYGENLNFSDCEFRVKPGDQLMFIFPSYLVHYVPPFYTEDVRISVSGNLYEV